MMLLEIYDLAIACDIPVECHSLPKSKSLAIELGSDVVAIAIDPMQLESAR